NSFERTRWGRLLPFLFIWQFIFSGPLEIASGYIGFAQYVSYFWRSMSPAQSKLIALGIAAPAIALLYRRVTAIAHLTVILWAGVMITVLVVIASGLAHFDAKMAFDFPRGAFQASAGFAMGLAGAT